MSQTVSAPAKIILLGEHAVVYGQPSLAVPLSALRAYAEIVHLPQNSGLRITAIDLDNQEFTVNSHSTESDQPLVSAALLLLNDLGCTTLPDANIILRSDIPIASGMGSGAAITTALFRALILLLGKEVSDSHLNDLVYEVEKMHHGTPSGVDNTVIVFEKPIYFMRGKPIERIKIDKPFTLLVADTGIGASTKIAVADVRTLYNSNMIFITRILDSIGELVVVGQQAIENGDYVNLGHTMNENHNLLQKLTVSSPLLDKLVDIARGSGALGAKLSGGGRGGNMIALVSEESAPYIKEQLLDAGAIQVYQTVVKE
ncbi:MAG: mevalonate kinase [Anaerolineae bacterium]|nr:mevalonate kinase [Anaerolineae bacterium]